MAAAPAARVNPYSQGHQPLVILAPEGMRWHQQVVILTPKRILIAHVHKPLTARSLSTPYQLVIPKETPVYVFIKYFLDI